MTDPTSIFAVALVLAGIGAWPIYRALVALKARQTVSQHVAEHAHKQGTPTMGGLIALFGLLPALAVLASGTGRTGWGFVALVIGYTVIGFVDDFVVPRLMKGKRGLGWTQKLLMQIGFAAIGALLLQPSNTPALLFNIFCILFFSNAYNFTDGLDWLASTVLVALALGGWAIATVVHATPLGPIYAALIGSILPFMVLNRPPARIFMGDVGAIPIGGLLGMLIAITAVPSVAPSFTHATTVAPWGVLLGLVLLSFVMCAELIPVPLQIASVKIRKKRIFPMTPIHHAFQKAGWRETRVVALFFGVQVLCAVLGWAVATVTYPVASMSVVVEGK